MQPLGLSNLRVLQAVLRKHFNQLLTARYRLNYGRRVTEAKKTGCRFSAGGFLELWRSPSAKPHPLYQCFLLHTPLLPSFPSHSQQSSNHGQRRRLRHQHSRMALPPSHPSPHISQTNSHNAFPRRPKTNRFKPPMSHLTQPTTHKQPHSNLATL